MCTPQVFLEQTLTDCIFVEEPLQFNKNGKLVREPRFPTKEDCGAPLSFIFQGNTYNLAAMITIQPRKEHFLVFLLIGEEFLQIDDMNPNLANICKRNVRPQMYMFAKKSL
ncbi:Hypothetical predicted protein [Cloeon dipterum]|uniref:Uncharacterized protein n=1 Tax=Cloeon dipterum TaxID=197152 RepID=A0A8S1EF29_9INSE|nr:Hypothetical predicted protein [Cloeon dipterum]